MSDEMTTISFGTTLHPARGCYVMHPMHNTAMRVVVATPITWTIRYAYEWRWVEWLYARCEDCILWPITDLYRRLRDAR